MQAGGGGAFRAAVAAAAAAAGRCLQTAPPLRQISPTLLARAKCRGAGAPWLHSRQAQPLAGTAASSRRAANQACMADLRQFMAAAAASGACGWTDLCGAPFSAGCAGVACREQREEHAEGLGKAGSTWLGRGKLM